MYEEIPSSDSRGAGGSHLSYFALWAYRAAFLAIVFFSPSLALADTLQDRFNPSLPTNDDVGSLNTSSYAAMGITPASSYNISAFDVSARYDVSCGSSDTLFGSLRATSGGVPVGPDLASGTATGLHFTYSTINISFTSPYPVIAGVQYALVLHASCNIMLAQGEESASELYTGGAVYGSTNSGITWALRQDPDSVYMWFNTYSGGGSTASSSLLATATTTLALITGYDFDSVVSYFNGIFAMIAGGSFYVLQGLLMWIIALVVVGVMITFGLRAFRFFRH